MPIHLPSRFWLLAIGQALMLAQIAAPSAIAQCPPAGWQDLNLDSLDSSKVYAVHERPNGRLVVGGVFRHRTDSNIQNIAEWDGVRWTSLGTGVDSRVVTFLEDPDGSLIVGGSFSTAGGVQANGVARWRDGSWSSVGQLSANARVDALAMTPSGELVIGGQFSSIDGVNMRNVAMLRNGAWMPMAREINSRVSSLAALPDGSVVAGGRFSEVDGVVAYRIAQWHSGIWKPMGSGFNEPVQSLQLTRDGELYAHGFFTASGFQETRYVARWDGEGWKSLGSQFPSRPPNGYYSTLAKLEQGNILVCSEGLWNWNGTAWSLVDGSPDTCNSVIQLRNSERIVVGAFRGVYMYSPAATALAIVTQPEPLTACGRTPANLGVEVSGSRPLYRWRKNAQFIDIAANPSAATANLVIGHPRPEDAGAYDCVIANDCGSVTSNAATLSVCLADFTCDGMVDCFDYDSFVTAFETGSGPGGLDADFNADGFVDAFDYDDFVGAFEVGCE